MKANWGLLLFAQSFFLLVFFIGIPMTFSVKGIGRLGDKYQLTTPQHTLAKLIGLSKKANLLCEDQVRCVTPVDRHHFAAHIPIIFEDCRRYESELSCDDLSIKFNTTTRALVTGGFSR